MEIQRTVKAMQSASHLLRQSGRRLGFVPTMGALHEGHLSLVRAARSRCDAVAASIFVNPTQFGPNEDFSKYPRTFDHDCMLLEQEGVDVVFAPVLDEMYPAGSVTWVTVEGLSERLCGRSRPGHFRGVTTVVSKLFHCACPDVAFFGQKDAAQVAIIQRMVRDLNMPVEIEVCPIVREPDGLAMSSRNAYLGPEQRSDARVLFQSLRAVRKAYEAGEREVERLVHVGKGVFAARPTVRLDYFEIVSPEDLTPVAHINGPVLVAVAAFIGTTRLIDNILLPLA